MNKDRLERRLESYGLDFNVGESSVMVNGIMFSQSQNDILCFAFDTDKGTIPILVLNIITRYVIEYLDSQ